MKRLFVFLLMLLPFISGMAVLNEKDLEQTISVLRSELEYSKNEQHESLVKYRSLTQSQHDNIVSIMQQSEKVALMLYSQKQDYTFDLAYACHEATSLYSNFSSRQIPYKKILNKFQVEIDRYNNLIHILEQLPPRLSTEKFTNDSIDTMIHVRMNAEGEVDSLSHETIISQMIDTLKVIQNTPFLLSAEAQQNRDSCLVLAKEIKDNLIEMFNSISTDSEHYTFVSNRLKQVNDYALNRYYDIRQLIFKNGGDNYFEILMNFPYHLKNMVNDIKEKYYQPKDKKSYSEWRGPIVVLLAFFILFYFFIAFLLSNLIVRFFLPERLKSRGFETKSFYFIFAVSVILFAVVVLIMRGFLTHNFFIMASKLLVEYAFLVSAVLSSLLIRVNGNQIKSSFNIYTPILLMGFIIIVFRIVFISNSVVNVIFPPILLLFTLWQFFAVRKHNKQIPFIDMAYTYVSLIVMVVSCIASWIGYTLLAVQIFIWWLFQLTAIQAISCLHDVVNRYEIRFLTSRILKSDETLKVSTAARKAYSMMNPTKKEKGIHFEITWLYDLIRMTLLPIFAVMSVLICVLMAADIFDLTEYCKRLFFTNFINVQGVCQLSCQKLLTVCVVFFSFRFINYMAKSIYKKYQIRYTDDNEEANVALANNIISIFIWGSFFIIVLFLLRIPKSGISIVTAGLATGLGFAMKDILENFIYGLSLMTGRVRVGDFIECDGIRGKVDSITYQSTQIITLEGTVIAFLNSSLFNKNFKNLTRNHGYEFTTLEVGVAYGSNVKEVRKMLSSSLQSLYSYELGGIPSIDKSKGIDVYLKNFGDNSVNLYVTIWALVEDQFRISAVAKEIIYDTLNLHNIDIPFPQRTVYIKEIKKG